MVETILDVRGLTKSYGKKAVLNGVDLAVPAGAVVGLMGTNGAGKSTLIKCLLGLLRIDGGSAMILGCSPDFLTAAAKERLGYAPQSIYLYQWMKVRHVIDYHASFYASWDAAWAADLISRWRVPMDQRVNAISPGQLQTVALVLALGHQPDLLILDEPVASLDPIARRDFLKSLVEMDAQKSRTVLFSTHISSDLERAASHVAILRDGKIVCFSELDDLKDRMKRLRLSASSPLPANFSVPGSIRTKVEGASALVASPDVTPELIDELRDRWDAEVRVEDLSLEEIFVEIGGHA